MESGDRRRGDRMKARAIVLVTVLAAGLGVPTSGAGASIPRILFYEPSLTEDKPLNEAEIAQLAGYEIRVADEDRWRSMTTEEFAVFDAIVVGDPNCGGGYYGEDYMAAIRETRDAWSPAVTGQVILVGMDPMYHQRREGAVTLTENALDWAIGGDSTGMYFSLSCYYVGNRGGTIVKELKGLGEFEVRGQGRGSFPSCPDSMRISLTGEGHPAMEGLTDELLSNWRCSAHEAFDSYPEGWVKLVGERRTHLGIVVARDDGV
jgi:hypothetical protein